MKNFEKYTAKLTKNEFRMIPLVIEALKSEKYVPSGSISDYIYEAIQKKTEGRRIRKIINYIRCNRIAAIVSTQDGYRISDNAVDIQNCIDSLSERLAAQIAAIEGLLDLKKRLV